MTERKFNRLMVKGRYSNMLGTITSTDTALSLRTLTVTLTVALALTLTLTRTLTRTLALTWQHPAMKSVLLAEVQRFVLRPGMAERLSLSPTLTPTLTLTLTLTPPHVVDHGVAD